MAKNNLIDLFLELANPNIETGKSRWVDTSEFVGKYKGLVLGNGWSWGRKSSRLQRKYKVEVKREGAGNAITAIRLIGYNGDKHFSQNVKILKMKSANADVLCLVLKAHQKTRLSK